MGRRGLGFAGNARLKSGKEDTNIVLMKPDILLGSRAEAYQSISVVSLLSGVRSFQWLAGQWRVCGMRWTHACKSVGLE
jgi:hypothetical protein